MSGKSELSTQEQADVALLRAAGFMSGEQGTRGDSKRGQDAAPAVDHEHATQEEADMALLRKAGFIKSAPAGG